MMNQRWTNGELFTVSLSFPFGKTFKLLLQFDLPPSLPSVTDLVPFSGFTLIISVSSRETITKCRAM